jgi:transcriptional regulator with XRE-family HTH domain
MNSITANEIKHLRMSIGWSAVDMGEFFNRTAATIYNWENGDSAPGATTTALMKTLRHELNRRRESQGATEVREWIEELSNEGLHGFLKDLSVRPGFTHETYRKLARAAEEEGGLLLSSAADEPLAYVVPLTEQGLVNYTRCLLSPAIEEDELPGVLNAFANQLREKSNGDVSISVTTAE